MTMSEYWRLGQSFIPVDASVVGSAIGRTAFAWKVLDTESEAIVKPDQCNYSWLNVQ